MAPSSLHRRGGSVTFRQKRITSLWLVATHVYTDADGLLAAALAPRWTAPAPAPLHWHAQIHTSTKMCTNSMLRLDNVDAMVEEVVVLGNYVRD